MAMGRPCTPTRIVSGLSVALVRARRSTGAAVRRWLRRVLVAKPSCSTSTAQSVVWSFPKTPDRRRHLNRPVALTLKDVFLEEPQFKAARPALFRGPVHVNALMFLFRCGGTSQNASRLWTICT